MGKEIVKCPVCSRDCVGRGGLNSHLFKSKDLDHIKFIEQQDVLINQAFLFNMSCECYNNIVELFHSGLPISRITKSCGISDHQIRKIWRKVFGFELVERRKLKPIGPRSIEKEVKTKIIELFHSDLTIDKISKNIGINYQKIRKIWCEIF